MEPNASQGILTLNSKQKQRNTIPSATFDEHVSCSIQSLKDPQRAERSKVIVLTDSFAHYVSPNRLAHLTQQILQHLFEEKDPLLVENIVFLLAKLATRKESDIPSILDALHRYLQFHSMFDDSVTTQIICSLICIEKSRGAWNEVDGRMVLHLLCSNKVGLRTKVLKLLRVSFRCRDEESEDYGQLAFNIFNAFTKDPYPSVRQAALEGLVTMHTKGFNLTEACYKRAVSLLQDTDELVRLSAIKVVQQWVSMLHQLESAANQIDEAFLQLCAISRDMAMQVRVEVLHALGRMGPISESVLLQALSKKILQKRSKKYSVNLSSKAGEGGGDLEMNMTSLDILTLSGAGVFLHGVEDEFFQVRMAAVEALSSLSQFSSKFADNALDLLMDMLNDSFLAVRLHTLHQMLNMAGNSHLIVQDKHMHMLLGMLEDTDHGVRSEARKLLGRLVLPSISVFKLTVDAVLMNLDKNPQDEEEIIPLVYDLGTSNSAFVTCMVDQFVKQLKDHLKDNLGLDQPQVAASMILLFAAHATDSAIHFLIPEEVVSQAKFLKRKFFGALGLERYRQVQSLLFGYGRIRSSDAKPSSSCPEPITKRPDDNRYTLQMMDDETYLVESHVLQSVDNLVRNALDSWSLQKHRAGITVKVLRDCKNCLGNMNTNSELGRSVLSFSSLYLHSVYVFTKLWINLTSAKRLDECQHGLDPSFRLLEHLENALRRLMDGFLGLSKEQKSCIAVLEILTCILRLSLPEVDRPVHIRKRLKSLISFAELLHEGYEIKTYSLIEKLNKVLSDKDASSLCFLELLSKLPEYFTLQPFRLNRNLKEIRATLIVSNDSYDDPLAFISGLPVGITLKIVCHNVTADCRLWLSMILGQTVLYQFIDILEFKSFGDMKECTICVPFYDTPKAPLCFVEVSVMKECLADLSFEEMDILHRYGPREKLVRLSDPQKVYLCERSFKK